MRKALEEARARVGRALGMELHAEPIAVAHHGRDFAAVEGAGDRRRAAITGKTVGEIDIVASLQADGWVRDRELAPAHVRDGHSRRRIERPHLTLEDSKALGCRLLAPLEQQLHAKTDAERRLGERAQAILQSGLLEALHCMSGGAYAGKHYPLSGADPCRIGSDERLCSKPLERQPDRSDIAISKVDDRKVHRTPLVLGSASPSRRIASLSARPSALKQASVLWWSLSPSTLT